MIVRVGSCISWLVVGLMKKLRLTHCNQENVRVVKDLKRKIAVFKIKEKLLKKVDKFRVSKEQLIHKKEAVYATKVNCTRIEEKVYTIEKEFGSKTTRLTIHTKNGAISESQKSNQRKHHSNSQQGE